MNRRKFLQNGAMAIVAASVAPAAVLAIEESGSSTEFSFDDGKPFVHKCLPSMIIAGWITESGGIELIRQNWTKRLGDHLPEEFFSASRKLIAVHDGDEECKRKLTREIIEGLRGMQA